MKTKNIVTILLVVFMMASCAPVITSVPTETAIPTSTFTSIPLTSTITTTPKPPTPTPVQANFVPPVDEKVPQYNAFDLSKAEGTITSNAGEKYNGITYKCNGAFFVPGTKDNHFAYDYGTGNCSKHFVGTKVYGMSVGFYGTVISVGNESEKYATKIDYGKIKCTDGKVRHIVIQFAHSIPLVEVGDIVDSTTVIAEMEKVSVEVEIMVIDETGNAINPELIGLLPRCPSFCQ